MLVKVDAGWAQARDEREDMGRFEDSAQSADRRAKRVGERNRLDIIEQIEGCDVAASFDEQVPRSGPLALGGPVGDHDKVVAIDLGAHQRPDSVVFIADRAPPHPGDDAGYSRRH